MGNEVAAAVLPESRPSFGRRLRAFLVLLAFHLVAVVLGAVALTWGGLAFEILLVREDAC